MVRKADLQAQKTIMELTVKFMMSKQFWCAYVRNRIIVLKTLKGALKTTASNLVCSEMMLINHASELK